MAPIQTNENYSFFLASTFTSWLQSLINIKTSLDQKFMIERVIIDLVCSSWCPVSSLQMSLYNGGLWGKCKVSFLGECFLYLNMHRVFLAIKFGAHKCSTWHIFCFPTFLLFCSFHSWTENPETWFQKLPLLSSHVSPVNSFLTTST